MCLLSAMYKTVRECGWRKRKRRVYYQNAGYRKKIKKHESEEIIVKIKKCIVVKKSPSWSYEPKTRSAIDTKTVQHCASACTVLYCTVRVGVYRICFTYYIVLFQGSQLQESGSNSSLLQKIMTPAPVEYDTGSLKRSK